MKSKIHVKYSVYITSVYIYIYSIECVSVSWILVVCEEIFLRKMAGYYMILSKSYNYTMLYCIFQ